jgi:glycosyltransferase involved in cell wall biosynthesis
MNSIPFISIIIPVYNEERHIERTLETLLGQEYPAHAFEIIVVDGMSGDRTAALVRAVSLRDSRVSLLANPKRLSSAARNIGIRAARGEIITFIDGHVHIGTDQLLKNTARLMADKEVRVLSRPQFLDTPDNKRFQDAVALVRRSRLGHGSGSTIYASTEAYVDADSAGATYHREVVESVGEFDESFDAAEDFEFNYRVRMAGYRSFSSGKLAVAYYPRASFPALFTQMCRYGIGRLRLLRKHRDPGASGIIALLIPAAGYGALLAASLVFPPLLYVCAGLGLLYGAACTASCLAVDRRRTLRHLPLIPFIFATVHLGLLWGFVGEALGLTRKKSPSKPVLAVTTSPTAPRRQAHPRAPVRPCPQKRHPTPLRTSLPGLVREER